VRNSESNPTLSQKLKKQEPASAKGWGTHGVVGDSGKGGPPANCSLEFSRTFLATRVRWHQIVRTIVDHKLAIMLAAVLDGERPDGGVVGQPVPKKF
jgi:hypothetical protein